METAVQAPPQPISIAFAESYANEDPGWGFGGLGYIVFKRTYAREILGLEGVRTEEWHETVRRVVNGAQTVGAGYTQEEAEKIFDHMFYLRGLPSGRVLWQLGTSNNDRVGLDSLSSCWNVDISEVSDFEWAVDRLMLGGGVGFTVNGSERLGVVRDASIVHIDDNGADLIVADTREGWSGLIYHVINAFLSTDKRVKPRLHYATHLIREYGAPINGFGGVASGPGILITGVEQIVEILKKAAGRTLSSVETLDIMNIIGSIVVAGNVRRSAEIGQSDVFDREFLRAKRWDLGDIPNYRAMSNNSVFVTPQQMGVLAHCPDDALWDGYKGNGEPYGFLNLETARRWGRYGCDLSREDPTIVGFNPCGEIPLADRECCNLAEVFLPNLDSKEQMKEVSMLLYKMQKAISSMFSLDATSEEVTSQNMRLGLGVGGVVQALDRVDWLDDVYRYLRKFDEEWSAERGWPVSIRLTTVKPSGTISLLAGTTAGGHPAYSQFFVKNMRIAADHPLVKYCEDLGYHTEPVRGFDGTIDTRTTIISFPCSVSDETTVAADMTAIDQLDLVRTLQSEWADNAVSVTVYYKLEELDGIRQYLGRHWHEMKSVSFLLHSDHGFDQAPLVEISSDEYYDMLAEVRPLGEAMSESTMTFDLEDACAAGSCPTR